MAHIGDPQQHVGDPKGVTASEGHIWDSKGHTGDPKGVVDPKDVQGIQRDT